MVCTANYPTSGTPTFVQDTIYLRNSANTAWIGGGGGIHKHDANTDAGGGLLSEIFHANLTKALWENNIAPSAGQFKHETSGGATITDVHPNVRLFCGTSNGAYAHATRSGIPVSWSGIMRFAARLYVSHGSYVTVRFGVCSESANDTAAADGGGIRRMGFEACDSTGTAKAYDVFRSNGTTRTATTQTFNVAQGSPHAYRLDYTPGVNIIPFYDGAQQSTITSSVAAGGVESTNIRIVSAGIKQNNSFTLGNERTMFLSGIALAATAGSTAWT